MASHKEPVMEAVTTLMFRNMPRRYTNEHLLREVEASIGVGAVDFVLVPWQASVRNLGYGFVNFVSGSAAASAALALEGKAWLLAPANKGIKIMPSDTQGLMANLLVSGNMVRQGRATLPLVFFEGRQASWQEAVQRATRQAAANHPPREAPAARPMHRHPRASPSDCTGQQQRWRSPQHELRGMRSAQGPVEEMAQHQLPFGSHEFAQVANHRARPFHEGAGWQRAAHENHALCRGAYFPGKDATLLQTMGMTHREDHAVFAQKHLHQNGPTHGEAYGTSMAGYPTVASNKGAQHVTSLADVIHSPDYRKAWEDVRSSIARLAHVSQERTKVISV